MKKEIRTVDPQRGLWCCTTLDERFYAKECVNESTGLPEMQFRPSVTWICDYFPKGRGFEHWLKKHGDESDQIARLAADRGYVIHRAIAKLNAGETVCMSDFFEDSAGSLRELTADEYAGVMSYVAWWEESGRATYELEAFEYTLWPDVKACAERYTMDRELFRYAGTVDLRVRRIEDNMVGIIDCKTSLDIWPSHEMQVSAYRMAEGADWAAILQLDYRRNKKKQWKLTEIPNRFDLFCATRQIWKYETEGIEPLQRAFPLELSLNLPKKVVI